MIQSAENNEIKEWCLGTFRKKNKTKHKKNTLCVVLPFNLSAIYPIDESDDTYCTCIKCNNSINEGLLTLEFLDADFGLRLCCEFCYKDVYSSIVQCFGTVFEIESILRDILNNPKIDQNQNKCLICDTKNCKSNNCAKILNQNRKLTCSTF